MRWCKPPYRFVLLLGQFCLFVSVPTASNDWEAQSKMNRTEEYHEEYHEDDHEGDKQLVTATFQMTTNHLDTSYHLESKIKKEICCPVLDCHIERYHRGEKQVFEHLRLYHNFEDIPTDFLLRHFLAPCIHCKMPYVSSYLKRHMKRCPKKPMQNRPIITSQDPVISEVQVTGTSNSTTSQDDSEWNSQPSVDSNSILSDGIKLSDSWSFLEQLGTESICLHIIPTVRQVQTYLQTSFRECCAVPLTMIAENSMNDAAWKLILLIPRFLLQPVFRGGTYFKTQNTSHE